ncbi:flavin reductase family protein [Fodinicola feengrottensis]|uniref:Flavin reductase family protein n=1 Tax=Fodinicola feengrottensis TaxID=435914 RepID=A0ABN2J277_9ACTN|nr:flavin reductase family protein [Fodinicola feengrottensis]
MSTVSALVTDSCSAGVEPLFREVFRQHAVGVAVITAGADKPVGFTATSLVSVSADPPLLSFNISRTASSWPTLSRSEYVAVHLLAEHQGDLARVFATSGIDRFAAVPGWRHGPYQVPLLPNVLAHLVARVHTRIEAGDHVVVIAAVVDGAVPAGAGIDGPHPEAAPLVAHQGIWKGLR